MQRAVRLSVPGRAAAAATPQDVEVCSRVVRGVLGQKERDPVLILAAEAILLVRCPHHHPYDHCPYHSELS